MPTPQECAQVTADALAARAAVTVEHTDDTAALSAAVALFERVWGRSVEGVPMTRELLRSLAHAGGAVTVARDRAGELAGAAVQIRSGAADCYSLIAAARPGGADRGVGMALKLAQRAWALERGLSRMRWTFDPLVARNARFNLMKLGADAEQYLPGFYAAMTDEINAGDGGDRLVATWRLSDPELDSILQEALARGPSGAPPARRVVAAEPDPGTGRVLESAPDGGPLAVAEEQRLWCRVPSDIVAVRRADAATARSWRAAVREVFVRAIGSGLGARGFTTSGWYLLSTREPS